MALPRNPVQLPPSYEFRALSSLYVCCPWYSLAVQERPAEVVVTLAPTDWRRAARRAAVLAVLWSLFIGVAWLLNPDPFHYTRAMASGAVIYLWPLYFPLLRHRMLNRRLPWIRFDKSLGVVHLFAGSRQVPLSDVVAICDVIARGKPGSDDDSLDGRYELQLLLRKPRGTEFVLLAGGWHCSAAKRFAPVTSEIANRLGIPHFSVDAVGGTIVEQSQSGMAANKE